MAPPDQGSLYRPPISVHSYIPSGNSLVWNVESARGSNGVFQESQVHYLQMGKRKMQQSYS